MNNNRELQQLNSLPVVELLSTQRRLGRNRLPSEFIGFWAKQHSYAKELLNTSAIRDDVRKLAQLLKDGTYSLATFAAVPIDQGPAYYPYTDAHVLDSFLGHHRAPYHRRVARAALGIHTLLLALHRLESRTLSGLESNHME